jgi:mycothiol synthase
MRRPSLDDLPAMPALPEGYALRAAVSEDAPAVAEVMSSAFGPEWTPDRVLQALLDAPDVKVTYVVTANDKPVATASARLVPDRYPNSGYVHWVGSHQEHRGRGLGAIASIAVLQYFRAIGCRDAVLETDPFRLPAIRTYLKLGFVPEHVDPEHERVWREVFEELEAFGRLSAEP